MNDSAPVVTIRQAEPGDVPLVLRFIRDKAAFDGVPDWVRATEADLHTHLFGPNPSAYVAFGLLDQRVVGFAIYYFTFSSFLGLRGVWLDDLFVQPDARGRGVGKSLLAHLAKVAEANDCGRLEWVTAISNDKGLAFYRQNGAQVQERVRVLRINQQDLSLLAGGAT
jgi:GNAT superfamily N-acetyltransferase